MEIGINAKEEQKQCQIEAKREHKCEKKRAHTRTPYLYSHFIFMQIVRYTAFVYEALL